MCNIYIYVYIYIYCVTVSHKQLWLVIFQTSICIRGHATEMVQLKKIKDLIHGSSNEQTGLEKVGKQHLLRSPKSRIYLSDCHQGPIVDVTSEGIKCPVWFMKSLNRIVISLNSGEFRCALGMKHMMHQHSDRIQTTILGHNAPRTTRHPH